MLPRRFINLMMKDLSVGGSYWLSRLRPEENLFYSSVVEAAASEKLARRDKRKTTCLSTMELPLPDFRFNSSRSFDTKLSFMPFYGLGGGPSEGRIVVSDSAGLTHLYDAEQASGEMLPPTGESSNWHSPISVCIAKDGIRANRLYAINALNSTNFKSLTYCNGNKMSWRWLDLPPPPYTLRKEEQSIQSYTLLEDDKTICFSSVPGRGFGTYCFNTSSLKWTKAGSWTLPFAGRALRVPQLHNLYFGFLDSNEETLVAIELPTPLDRDAPPKVMHQWLGFRGPQLQGEWLLLNSNLLYLGNRRFCVAKIYSMFDESPEPSEDLDDMVAILTGVEIVNVQANKAKLQMIKHKTRTYAFDRSSIESVL